MAIHEKQTPTYDAVLRTIYHAPDSQDVYSILFASKIKARLFCTPAYNHDLLESYHWIPYLPELMQQYLKLDMQLPTTHIVVLRHSYAKMSAGSDTKTQIIYAVVIQHHPVSHDTSIFQRFCSR